MKNQIQILLNKKDEVKWSRLLRETVPGIIFLNDNVWKAAPDQRFGIEECASGRAYLFNKELQSLPHRTRENGDLEGPVSGCVIQVLRSVQQGGVILSGRMAAGYETGDEAMKAFASQVWNTLVEIGVCGVLTSENEVNSNYLVGNSLAADVQSGTLQIADRATGIPFKLASEPSL